MFFRCGANLYCDGIDESWLLGNEDKHLGSATPAYLMDKKVRRLIVQLGNGTSGLGNVSS
jgi:hypothetical protein